MLWNLGVKRIRGKLQFHAGRVVRFGAGAAAGGGPAHSPAPDLFRSQNSSLPRGSLSLSRSWPALTRWRRTGRTATTAVAACAVRVSRRSAPGATQTVAPSVHPASLKRLTARRLGPPRSPKELRPDMTPSSMPRSGRDFAAGPATQGRISGDSRSRVPRPQARQSQNGATTPLPDPRCRHPSAWSARSRERRPDHRRQEARQTGTPPIPPPRTRGPDSPAPDRGMDAAARTRLRRKAR